MAKWISKKVGVTPVARQDGMSFKATEKALVSPAWLEQPTKQDDAKPTLSRKARRLQARGY